MPLPNTTPIFPLTPRVNSCLVGAAALTTRTAIAGTTGLTLLATSGLNGTRVDKISTKGAGTTLAGLIDIWIHDGTTSRLFKSTLIAAVTASTTVDAPETALTFTDLVLPANHSLYVSSQVANQLVSVFMFGGDY